MRGRSREEEWALKGSKGSKMRKERKGKRGDNNEKKTHLVSNVSAIQFIPHMSSETERGTTL